MAKSSKTKTQAPTRTLPIGGISDIQLIGCGGTGAILAEHLCRMIVGFRLKTSLTLWDGDRVEVANIVRQNFQPYEVGANKAQTLALRLAGQFGIEVTAQQDYLKRLPPWGDCLIITCTDTLQSRRIVAESMPSFWLDVGNERHHGQAIFGTTHIADRLRVVFWNFNRRPHAVDLPDIAALNPQILKARKTRTKAGCADQPFRYQGFGINAMAALAAAILTKQIIVDGSVSLAGFYFDISDGRMLPRLITQDLFSSWKKK